MKKIIIALVLIAGIKSPAFAQILTGTDQTFELPAEFFGRQFYFDLAKGNSMQAEVYNIEDLALLHNIDSIIAVFLQDIAPLKDSLSDELAVKKIDQLIERGGRKKMRLLVIRPTAATYLLRGSMLSSLKTQQDTVTITGLVEKPASIGIGKPFSPVRYYRLRFVVNDIYDLELLRDQNLGDKIAMIEAAKKSHWSRDKNGDWHLVKGDQAISAKNPGGYISGTRDYIELRYGAGAGNYKKFFVPSFDIGFNIVLNGKRKTSFGLSWEPTYIFSPDATGKLKTYRNDFYTLFYSMKSNVTDGKSFHLDPNLSISYLRRQRGGIFEDNTFRLSFSHIVLHDRIIIEPGMYFHDLFKNASPGIRVSF